MVTLGRPRPIKTTCEGCGDPDVPVQPKGQMPRFCVECAGPPRNPRNSGKSGAELARFRRRRWEREHPGEPFPEDDQEQEHDVAPEPVARPAPEPPGRVVDPHAEEVVEDQQAAQAYWSAQGAPAADLQPPDGPVVLNTPVGYDPTADPILGDVTGPDDLGLPAEPVTPDPLDAPLVLDDEVEYPARAASLCVAPGCELPHPGHGHDLFCRGHWRLVSLETRQRLLGAPEGPARNRAIQRCCFEIRRELGG